MPIQEHLRGLPLELLRVRPVRRSGPPRHDLSHGTVLPLPCRIRSWTVHKNSANRPPSISRLDRHKITSTKQQVSNKFLVRQPCLPKALLFQRVEAGTTPRPSGDSERGLGENLTQVGNHEHFALQLVAAADELGAGGFGTSATLAQVPLSACPAILPPTVPPGTNQRIPVLASPYENCTIESKRSSCARIGTCVAPWVDCFATCMKCIIADTPKQH
jgi:hypothetical protein